MKSVVGEEALTHQVMQRQSSAVWQGVAAVFLAGLICFIRTACCSSSWASSKANF